MTKRFWYDFEDCTGAKIVDFKEDKEYPLETIGDFKKIEKLLNEQHEQIEDLKDTNVRCCNEYSYFHKRMMELEKENEQLKQQVKQLQHWNKCLAEKRHQELKGDVE